MNVRSTSGGPRSCRRTLPLVGGTRRGRSRRSQRAADPLVQELPESLHDSAKDPPCLLCVSIGQGPVPIFESVDHVRIARSARFSSSETSAKTGARSWTSPAKPSGLTDDSVERRQRLKHLFLGVDHLVVPSFDARELMTRDTSHVVVVRADHQFSCTRNREIERLQAQRLGECQPLPARRPGELRDERSRVESCS
jgi:hypothetical protein